MEDSRYMIYIDKISKKNHEPGITIIEVNGTRCTSVDIFNENDDKFGDTNSVDKFIKELVESYGTYKAEYEDWLQELKKYGGNNK